MDGTSREQPLTDSQLDREIESAIGIEPSAEFLARVRTRIAAEPEPSAWRLAALKPLMAAAIAGIVLAVIVPRMFSPEPDIGEVARLNPDIVDVRRAPVTTSPRATRSVPGRPGEVRRRPPVAAETNGGRGSRRPSFEDLVLIAPAEQEAFDRLLVVVNDQTIELIAPVLESTRAGVDVIDAAVPVSLRAAEEGVNE